MASALNPVAVVVIDMQPDFCHPLYNVRQCSGFTIPSTGFLS